MPIIMPCRRRSKGIAASSTTSSVAAAPLARKPAPIHPIRWSEVTSSRRDDDHAAASPGADPVLRQRNALGGGRASCVDLRVGTAGADEFGELRMSHRQDPEQEAPVEDVRLPLDCDAQLRDATVQLLPKTGITIAGRAKRASLPTSPTARGERDLRNSATLSSAKAVTTGEGGAKNHAGIVTHGIWQSPSIRQLRAFGRGLITHDQRDAGVTQRVDSRSRWPGG